MANQQKPRRTQAERTRASREKIIQAASEYFAREGFRGARMADIARAAELTEPGLLHHFPNKTSLLMAVLAERDRVDHDRFTPDQPDEPGDLLAAFQKLVEHNETVPGLVQLFAILVAESIPENHPGHDFFLRRYQTVRGQSVAILRQGQARGEVRGDLPAEDLIVLVLAMMDGLQIQWLFEPESVDMARLFGQFVQLLRAREQVD